MNQTTFSHFISMVAMSTKNIHGLVVSSLSNFNVSEKFNSSVGDITKTTEILESVALREHIIYKVHCW